MKYRFNEFNNVTGFLRELLSEFNLPNIEVITDDSYIFEGKYYIKELNIVRCTKSGFVSNFGQIDGPTWEIIMPYYYNRAVLDLTSNLDINEHIYDSTLHEYLGNYLRFLRDYSELNLMPLYNCFSNKVVNSVSIFDPKTKFSIKPNDNLYTYYIIPVRLNKIYTIGVDSARPIEAACILYNETLLEKYYINEFENVQNLLVSNTYQKLNNCQLRHPTIYTKLCDLIPDITNDQKLSMCISNYHDIKLVLKVPTQNTSSIVVLEGNYADSNDNTGGCLTTIGRFGKKEDLTYSMNFPTQLSLLSVNDHLHHPFADKLIEYLAGGVITNLDDIVENITRTQNVISYLTPVSQRRYKIYGIWDESMNRNIYDYTLDSYTVPKEKKNYISNRYDLIKYSELSEDGSFSDWKDFVTPEQNKKIKDVSKDLLTYVDKDIEAYFMAVGR